MIPVRFSIAVEFCRSDLRGLCLNLEYLIWSRSRDEMKLISKYLNGSRDKTVYADLQTFELFQKTIQIKSKCVL